MTSASQAVVRCGKDLKYTADRWAKEIKRADVLQAEVVKLRAVLEAVANSESKLRNPGDVDSMYDWVVSVARGALLPEHGDST